MKMKICQRDGMDLLCTAEFWAMFRFPFKMRCTNFKINLMIHKLSFAKGRVWMLLYTSFCLKSLFETIKQTCTWTHYNYLGFFLSANVSLLVLLECYWCNLNNWG